MWKKIFFSFCVGCTLLSADLSLDLSQYEQSLYSQNGEDGVLAKIFQLLPPTSYYCVELGAFDGITGSNTYLLRLQGWDCLLLDRAYEMPEYKLRKEFITAENINQLFEQYEVPYEFGLLSIDVDYNDFHLWNALDSKYRPAVVVVEYNATYLSEEDKVVKYYPFYCGDGSDYFGASIQACYRLGKSKGYSLIYAEQAGRHLFFVRDDLIQEYGLIFKDMNEVKKIYRAPSYTILKSGRKGPTFTSSDNLIQRL